MRQVVLFFPVLTTQKKYSIVCSFAARTPLLMGIILHGSATFRCNSATFSSILSVTIRVSFPAGCQAVRYKKSDFFMELTWVYPRAPFHFCGGRPQRNQPKCSRFRVTQSERFVNIFLLFLPSLVVAGIFVVVVLFLGRKCVVRVERVSQCVQVCPGQNECEMEMDVLRARIMMLNN